MKKALQIGGGNEAGFAGDHALHAISSLPETLDAVAALPEFAQQYPSVFARGGFLFLATRRRGYHSPVRHPFG